MEKIPVLDKEFQLVIPTHGRSDHQTTLRKLPQSVKDRTLVITSLQSEVKEIKKNYGHKAVFSLESFGALDTHGKQIHTKRQWIIENVRSKFIMQLDDDMTFFRRCLPKYRIMTKQVGRWKLTEEGKARGLKLLYTSSATDIEKTINLMHKQMSKGFVHGGLGSRMGNDMEEDEVDLTGGRTMHAIVHDRKFLLKNDIRFDEIDFREDFNVTLHLLRRGLPNARLFCYAVSPEAFDAKGGCSTYRTFDASNDAALRLALLHPGFVIPRFTEYSYSGSRVEVTIRWMEAVNKGPGLGNVVKVKPVKCNVGLHTILPYESDTELFSFFDGEKWSTPSFSPKDNATTWFTKMPFRIKKKNKLF